MNVLFHTNGWTNSQADSMIEPLFAVLRTCLTRDKYPYCQQDLNP